MILFTDKDAKDLISCASPLDPNSLYDDVAFDIWAPDFPTGDETEDHAYVRVRKMIDTDGGYKRYFYEVYTVGTDGEGDVDCTESLSDHELISLIQEIANQLQQHEQTTNSLYKGLELMLSFKQVMRILKNGLGAAYVAWKAKDGTLAELRVIENNGVYSFTITAPNQEPFVAKLQMPESYEERRILAEDLCKKVRESWVQYAKANIKTEEKPKAPLLDRVKTFVQERDEAKVTAAKAAEERKAKNLNKIRTMKDEILEMFELCRYCAENKVIPRSHNAWGAVYYADVAVSERDSGRILTQVSKFAYGFVQLVQCPNSDPAKMTKYAATNMSDWACINDYTEDGFMVMVSRDIVNNPVSVSEELNNLLQIWPTKCEQFKATVEAHINYASGKERQAR